MVQPGAVAAAADAEAQAAARRDQAREAMLHDLEAARYAADRAFRQYDAADPENRLVAAELEARWNRALTRVGEIETRIADHDATAPRRLDLDPVSFATLAQDLQAVWTAPSTDARLKKRIVRTVIHEVVADLDAEAAEIVLMIHWIGGAHTELRLPRRRRGQRNSTCPDIIAAVRQLVLIVGDDLIAGILNRNGLTTGHGNRWTRERVTSLRSHHRIPVHRPALDGCEPWLNLSLGGPPRGLAPNPPDRRRGWPDRGRASFAGRPLDLQPIRPRRASCADPRFRDLPRAKTPRSTGPQPAKPLSFNNIDRWVL